MSRVHNLPIVWTQGLTGEPKARFEDAIKSVLATPVMARLSEIIEDKMNGLDTHEGSVADYDTPSWSHKQAHRNGLRQGYLDVLKLINATKRQST